MNLNLRECPELAGGLKIAAVVVVVGLIVAASVSPIDWSPTTTVHEVAAREAAAADTEYFPSGYTLNAVEPTPYVDAF
jgi:hypothetical protein